jgi:mannose-6-phosphate isomerase-like protein (cupin superfamily)
MALLVVFLIGAIVAAAPKDRNRGFKGGREMNLQAKEQPTGAAFDLAEMNKIRAKKKSLYHSFLNTSTLHCGVYHLKAGAKDPQSPHKEDEVYYVESGKAKLTVDDETFDCQPGVVLFVAAEAKHHFHDIEKDLTLLVFFSKAKPKPIKNSE